ncbi:hypothetical protein BC831DRAFT_475423 [Entophlyctis helioformis]|nr:hypothetical protein BC831DRAFT_475423 [Entophlyctis helioformis]
MCCDVLEVPAVCVAGCLPSGECVKGERQGKAATAQRAVAAVQPCSVPALLTRANQRATLKSRRPPTMLTVDARRQWRPTMPTACPWTWAGAWPGESVPKASLALPKQPGAARCMSLTPSVVARSQASRACSVGDVDVGIRCRSSRSLGEMARSTIRWLAVCVAASLSVTLLTLASTLIFSAMQNAASDGEGASRSRVSAPPHVPCPMCLALAAAPHSRRPHLDGGGRKTAVHPCPAFTHFSSPPTQQQPIMDPPAPAAAQDTAPAEGDRAEPTSLPPSPSGFYPPSTWSASSSSNSIGSDSLWSESWTPEWSPALPFRRHAARNARSNTPAETARVAEMRQLIAQQGATVDPSHTFLPPAPPPYKANGSMDDNDDGNDDGSSNDSGEDLLEDGDDDASVHSSSTCTRDGRHPFDNSTRSARTSLVNGGRYIARNTSSSSIAISVVSARSSACTTLAGFGDHKITITDAASASGSASQETEASGSASAANGTPLSQSTRATAVQRGPPAMSLPFIVAVHAPPPAYTPSSLSIQDT